MAALNEINQAGLRLCLHGDQVRVENAHRLTDRLRNLIRENKAALISQLSKTSAAEIQMNVREAIEERAGILEHEAGLPKAEAEQEAVSPLRVYCYRHKEHPDRELIAIMPGCNLDEARRCLKARFGDNLLMVHQYTSDLNKLFVKEQS
ncbi:MAG: hypothetical protein PHY16_16545 [Methylobacter sp.]|nr:hypothetical protein [Methylobacter sp.]